ncbi:MAG: DUF222 domain-containing protein, partial [Microlunatus sp.]|nr:DUF222 domain-containing protein [Microlunatus sp.]
MVMDEVDDAADVFAARDRLAGARRDVAVAQARVAAAAVGYADARAAADRSAEAAQTTGSGRVRAGEFVADEVSLMLREQPWSVRCLIARTRRLRTSLPSVWEGFVRGEVDAEQVRVIDRLARRVAEESTLVAIDEAVVEAAQTRTPKQLGAWVLRLVVRCEPLAFERRHRRALAERRVSVVQGADGIGYVTGEVSAADAAAIDAQLAWLANSLGTDDPRSHQQRRADVFADLLLGRLHLDYSEDTAADHTDGSDRSHRPDGLDGPGGSESQERDAGADPCAGEAWGAPAEADPAEEQSPAEETGRAKKTTPPSADWDGDGGWLEIEHIDPDTGELLGTSWQYVDADGEWVGAAAGPRPEPGAAEPRPAGVPAGLARRRSRPPLRIGIVVPLTSLLGLDECPAELADRSAAMPAARLRQLIAGTLGDQPGGSGEVLFTRLLTDGGGRLL